MTDVVLAIDVGGTTIASGLVAANGDVLWSAQTATVESERGRDPGLRQLADAVRHGRREAANHAHVVRAVSLGFPEYVNGDRLTSSEVITWDRQPVEVLGDDLAGVPLFVDSDVRCAALAEARVAAASERDVFYVSWGTGISSTLVVNGTCRAGRRGEALALGELDVPAVVDPTWTANLEQFASGDGIARRYAAARPGAPPHDGRAIAELAGAGDPDAAAIIHTAGCAVASAVGSCIAILDPDVVVFGGGIGAGDGVLVVTMRRQLDLLLSRPGPPALRRARTGPRAGVIGAGLSGWQRLDAAAGSRRGATGPAG